MADENQNTHVTEEIHSEGDGTVEKSKDLNTQEAAPAPEKSEEIDEELNQLLDSALSDFDKQGAENVSTATAPSLFGPGDGGGAHGAKKEVFPPSSDPMSDMFAEEFSDSMAKQFEEAMKSFMEDDPEMFQQIEKLASTAPGPDETADSQQEFADTLKHTMESLAKNTENLQDHMTDEDLMKAFSGMSMEGGGQEGFMPMMQGMMKTLLSKEVLYPSLKEISEKYPKWLEENKSSLPSEQYNNYGQQHSIIQRILLEFEKEKSTDTDDVKRQRFECIMDLMQQMQDLGQPPKDIVGDMAPGLEFDDNGFPKLPGSATEGCRIM